jgi:hypothetical protein
MANYRGIQAGFLPATAEPVRRANDAAPKLTVRKNRKLKRVKELYPEINIKLFKRRELRNMMLRFGMEEEAERIFGTDAQEEWE